MRKIEEIANGLYIPNCRCDDDINSSLRNAFISEADEQKSIVIDIFKQWLYDNLSITYSEENRTMLEELLHRIEHS